MTDAKNPDLSDWRAMEMDERFAPAVDLLRRTGMLSWQIRFQDDEKPTVWLTVGEWNVGPDEHPLPRDEPGEIRYKAAAALNPLDAVFALCDVVVDGGTCVHCARPTGFIADIGPTIANNLMCWQQYDPELRVFRRGCEGDA